MGRNIGRGPPEGGDTEGKDKTDQVQLAPGLEPGDTEDAAVEQGVIGKEHDMAAAAGGHQHRRKKATDGAGDGQSFGFLQNRQGAGQANQADHHRQGQRHGQ